MFDIWLLASTRSVPVADQWQRLSLMASSSDRGMCLRLALTCHLWAFGMGSVQSFTTAKQGLSVAT